LAPTIWRKGARAFEECSGGGEPSSRLGATGRFNEFKRNFFIRGGGAFGSMPGATVWLGIVVGGLCECAVYSPPCLGRRSLVHGGPHKRVEKLNPPIDFQQPGRFRGRAGGPVDLETLAGAPQESRVAQRVGGSNE
jgi:hypothetical protein